MIKELSLKEFETEVLKNDKKVLVDFNAEWCGPCQMLRPILDELAEENENIAIYSVDIDAEDELAREYSVISIPCLVAFENGKETNRNIGLMSKKKILKLLGE